MKTGQRIARKNFVESGNQARKLNLCRLPALRMLDVTIEINSAEEVVLEWIAPEAMTCGTLTIAQNEVITLVRSSFSAKRYYPVNHKWVTSVEDDAKITRRIENKLARFLDEQRAANAAEIEAA